MTGRDDGIRATNQMREIGFANLTQSWRRFLTL
jgi:hypothetical protein